jgi:hypothetical protein
MYFPDLYVEEMHFDVKAIKVGWLDSGEPYSKSDEDPETLEKIAALIIKLDQIGPAIFTKGFHVCPFCQGKTSSTQFNIKVDEKTFYDAPHMIIHYMLVHDYMPPQEFIDAVMNYKK